MNMNKHHLLNLYYNFPFHYNPFNNYYFTLSILKKEWKMWLQYDPLNMMYSDVSKSTIITLDNAAFQSCDKNW